MTNRIILFILSLIGSCFINTQHYSMENEVSSPIEVQMMPLGIVNQENAWSFTPTISKDGTTMIWGMWKNPDLTKGMQSIQELYISKKVDGQWSEANAIEATQGARVDYPHFSQDGKYFYLSYNKYHSQQYNYPNESNWDDFDLWRADCNAAGVIDWESFAPIDNPLVNRQKTPENNNIRYVHNETSPRTDTLGNLYFWSERLDTGIGRRDIFQFTSAGNIITYPEPINSRYKESGICVSPDGTTMIFSSDRPGGFGGQDLYRSTKNQNGQWSNPVNLGALINTSDDEFCPEWDDYSKMLLFTSNRPSPLLTPLDCGEGIYTYAAYQILLERVLQTE